MKKKKIGLQSFERYPTKESQKKRYENAGFSSCLVFDMFQVYNKNELIDSNEKKRIEKLEWLDEVEEWKIILEHYSLLLAFQKKNDSKENNLLFDFISTN